MDGIDKPQPFSFSLLGLDNQIHSKFLSRLGSSCFVCTSCFQPRGFPFPAFKICFFFRLNPIFTTIMDENGETRVEYKLQPPSSPPVVAMLKDSRKVGETAVPTPHCQGKGVPFQCFPSIFQCFSHTLNLNNHLQNIQLFQASKV